MQTTDNQQELFVVVDKDDNILGYRTRFECHHDKKLIHRGANLLIFNDKDEILLQQRSLTKDKLPGWWMHAVGGHVGQGETYEEAIKRETWEELGVEVQMKFVSKFLFIYPQETEMETLYTAVSDGPFFPDPVEVSQVRFFSKNMLQKSVKSGSIKLTDLARHCLELVEYTKV